MMKFYSGPFIYDLIDNMSISFINLVKSSLTYTITIILWIKQIKIIII